MSAKTATAANPLGLVAVIGLAIVVAVPFIFIVLQAIFPQIGQGVFSAPFVHLPALFEDPKLLRMTGNTILLGVSVVVLSAIIAVPLAVFRALYKVPLATPGLAASLLLVFASAIEEYDTPAALGSRSGFDVLVTEIDLRISDWPIDLSGAAVFSLALVLLSLAAFMLQRWILTRRSYVTTGGKPQNKDKRDLGAFKVPVVILFGGAFAATGVPLLAILATAMSKTVSGGLTLSNLGFDNFADIADNSAGAMRAFTNTLSLGVASALLTGLLVAIAAYAVVKMRCRGRFWFDVLTVLPNSLPGVVVAVGLILAWNQPSLLISPYNTPLILLLAYCCILLPQSIRYATAAFHQIGDNLEAAARVCVASSFRTFRRIILPLIAPSLITQMLLVFAVATRELVASTLVAPVGMQTISIFIWRQFEQGSIGLGMAMAFIAILLTTLPPLLLMGLLKRTGLVKV
ncbi:ABC transporter permease subunit [Ochrobactrum sp. Marseille-Q0166]|uniref:ABC transporter permease n=1 Tax=Ochrobactrum sp. Marseille-Q0166 TaxID=2761105 RepID=UPI001654FCF1|nr:ABC transporter permease subunit [Ochrobactrum sp. Marseille-Q0166]MBC8718264.1 iron ABC transporter permease [Ochrobactrum sp. Marseille-Q0166]